MTRALLGGLIVAIVSIHAHADPMPPPKAHVEALAKVEATYKKPKQLTASFVQSVRYQATGIVKNSTGTIWISKPDKIRFDYTGKKRPIDSTFLFDGKQLIDVEHRNKEILKRSASASDLPALVAFFTGAGSLSAEFTIAAPSTKNPAIAGQIELQLVPKKPNASYAQLFLIVDDRTWTVLQTIVVNSSGDSSSFTFSKVDTTKPIPASWFTVDPKTVDGYKVTRF